MLQLTGRVCQFDEASRAKGLVVSVVVWRYGEGILRSIGVLLRQCESIYSGFVFGKDSAIVPTYMTNWFGCQRY